MIKGAAAASTVIRVDKDGGEVEKARRNLSKGHVLEIDLVLVLGAVESAIDAGTVVGLAVAESISSHLGIDIFTGFDPLIIAIGVVVVTHEIEAVLATVFELKPLAAG